MSRRDVTGTTRTRLGLSAFGAIFGFGGDDATDAGDAGERTDEVRADGGTGE